MLLALKRAVFDRVKKTVFFTQPMRSFNQTMLQTLKNNINLWKMGII